MYLKNAKWGPCAYVKVNGKIATQPVILWILLAGKLKWLPLNFGFNDRMRTAPIATQKVKLWILLGGKPKWLLLNFGFNDVMRTPPILATASCEEQITKIISLAQQSQRIERCLRMQCICQISRMTSKLDSKVRLPNCKMKRITRKKSLLYEKKRNCKEQKKFFFAWKRFFVCK